MEDIGVKDIIKKVLEFLLGFISAVIIMRLPLILPVSSGTAVDIFNNVCVITTIVAAILIIKRKTRVFGVGLIIPAGSLTVLLFIVYLLFKDGFP